MISLSAWDLLALWEQGYGCTAAQKGLLLATAAWPGMPEEQLAALRVGERDGRLLTLREHLFGAHFEGVVHCPECGERLELGFQAADIRVVEEKGVADSFTIDSDGYQVQFRLPTAQDLLAIDADQSNADNQRKLLERCLLDVQHNGETGTTVHLPPHIIEAIAAQMAAADSQADIQLNLNCPACAHEWPATFDIVSFLWQELHSWAIRTLREVHELGTAYGWSERNILSISPWRRQLYLQMAV